MMGIRSLWPWLLVGALLASAYTNIALYLRQPAAAGAPAASAIGDPGTIPSFHLAPGSSEQHCPTLDRLDLTPQQRDRIRQCSLTSLDRRTDLAIEINQASAKLKRLLSKTAVDNSGVLALADRISDLRSRQYKAWISSILVVRDVLTPEQLQLLHSLESD